MLQLRDQIIVSYLILDIVELKKRTRLHTVQITLLNLQ